MTETPLSPTDARHAFLISVSEVIHAVDTNPDQTAALIAGAGNRRDLPLLARRIVYKHWERLDALEALGAMWIIDQELDGLTTAITEIGIDATAALIADQVEQLGQPIDVITLADRHQHNQQRKAA